MEKPAKLVQSVRVSFKTVNGDYSLHAGAAAKTFTFKL